MTAGPMPVERGALLLLLLARILRGQAYEILKVAAEIDGVFPNSSAFLFNGARAIEATAKQIEQGMELANEFEVRRHAARAVLECGRWITTEVPRVVLRMLIADGGDVQTFQQIFRCAAPSALIPARCFGCLLPVHACRCDEDEEPTPVDVPGNGADTLH